MHRDLNIIVFMCISDTLREGRAVLSAEGAARKHYKNGKQYAHPAIRNPMHTLKGENMKANGTCSVAKWDEKDFSLLPNEMKITKADIEYSITGDIEGMAVVQYVMFYSHFNNSDPHESSAKYVGLIQFSGNISGKPGS